MAASEPSIESQEEGRQKRRRNTISHSSGCRQNGHAMSAPCGECLNNSCPQCRAPLSAEAPIRALHAEEQAATAAMPFTPKSPALPTPTLFDSSPVALDSWTRKPWMIGLPDAEVIRKLQEHAYSTCPYSPRKPTLKERTEDSTSSPKESSSRSSEEVAPRKKTSPKAPTSSTRKTSALKAQAPPSPKATAGSVIRQLMKQDVEGGADAYSQLRCCFSTPQQKHMVVDTTPPILAIAEQISPADGQDAIYANYHERALELEAEALEAKKEFMSMLAVRGETFADVAPVVRFPQEKAPSGPPPSTCYTTGTVQGQPPRHAPRRTQNQWWSAAIYTSPSYDTAGRGMLGSSSQRTWGDRDERSGVPLNSECKTTPAELSGR